MPGLVYLLCAGTSLMCAILLLRGYRKTHVKLLLWSGVCFAGLSVENLILYCDRFVILDTDLSLLPHLVALTSRCVLLSALIWNVR